MVVDGFGGSQRMLGSVRKLLQLTVSLFSNFLWPRECEKLLGMNERF